MPRARSFARAAAGATSLVALLLAVGCESRRSAAVLEEPAIAPSSAPSGPRGQAGPGVSPPSPGATAAFAYVEKWSGGAHPGDHVPLILALHGLGDSPDRFARLYDGFTCPARLVLPHSDARYGPGYSWFPFRRGDPDFSAPDIARKADALAAFVTAEARAGNAAGRPIVTGFSQGGALSYALAARHGDEIGEALPVSGWLPDAVPETAAGRRPAEVSAFHGTDDPLIALDRARAAVARLSQRGFPAKLREYPGVSHQISEPERADYLESLGEACAREAKRP